MDGHISAPSPIHTWKYELPRPMAKAVKPQMVARRYKWLEAETGMKRIPSTGTQRRR